MSHSQWLDQRKRQRAVPAAGTYIVYGTDKVPMRSEYSQHFSTGVGEDFAERARKLTEQKEAMARTLRSTTIVLGSEPSSWETTNAQMDPRTVHLPSSRLSKATMDDLRREHFKYGTESIEWKSTTHSVHFTDTPVAGERRKAAMGASEASKSSLTLGHERQEYETEARKHYRFEPSAFKTAVRTTRDMVIDNGLARSSLTLGVHARDFETSNRQPDPRAAPDPTAFRGVFNEKARDDLQGAHFQLGYERSELVSESRSHYVAPGEPLAIIKLRKALVRRFGVNAMERAGEILPPLSAPGDVQLPRERVVTSLCTLAGVALGAEEVTQLFRHVDAACTGTVDAAELFTALRGAMDEERAETVTAVWFALAGDPARVEIPLPALLAQHRPEALPEVAAGELTPAQAHARLARYWTLPVALLTAEPEHVAPGAVTLRQWLDYYRGVSAAVADDEAFFARLRAEWGV